MHAALHRILGQHATQKGQNVDDQRLRFDFPELGGRAPFTFYWYDGTNLPPADLYAEFVKPGADGKPRELSTSGCLIIGDKGTMYAPGDYAEGEGGIQISEGLDWLEVDYPKPPGAPELGHVQEFYEAIQIGRAHV